MAFKGPYLNVKSTGLVKNTLMNHLHRMSKHTHTHARTNRLCRLDSYEAVVSFLPANIAESSVVRDVLGDVGDLVDRMVVLENLQEGTTGQI